LVIFLQFLRWQVEKIDLERSFYILNAILQFDCQTTNKQRLSFLAAFAARNGGVICDICIWQVSVSVEK